MVKKFLSYGQGRKQEISIVITSCITCFTDSLDSLTDLEHRPSSEDPFPSLPMCQWCCMGTDCEESGIGDTFSLIQIMCYLQQKCMLYASNGRTCNKSQNLFSFNKHTTQALKNSAILIFNEGIHNMKSSVYFFVLKARMDQQYSLLRLPALSI
jgi:hypothetical protein